MPRTDEIVYLVTGMTGKSISIFIFTVTILTTFIAAGVLLSGDRASGNDTAVLTYWTHTDPNRTELEHALIERFSTIRKDVVIERRTHGSQEISELVYTAFAAGRGPAIFNLQIENAYQYIVGGQVAPIDPHQLGYDSLEAVVDEYMPGVLDPVIHDGRLYGLPLELTNWAIYVNKAVFRDAGIDPESYPRTWEEVLEVSERIVRRDGSRIVRRGFDFRYSDYLIGIVPLVRQLGGRLINDEETEAIIGEEAWLQFLRFFREWGPAGRNLGSPVYENARSLFNENDDRVAMAHTGLYQQGRMKAENPEFYAGDDWMVIPFPLFEDAVHDVASSYYGHYMMVNANIAPDLQNAAWAFIQFLLDHPEEYLEQVNIVQPTRALMTSDLYRSMPYSAVFAGDMGRAEVVYYGKYSMELQELVKEAVESVLYGTSSPERAYARLYARAQSLLAGG